MALALGLYGSHVQAQFVAPYLDTVEFNSDIDYRRSFDVDHNDVILVDPSSFISSNITPATISSVRGAVVDGYHKDDAGLKYFSFDVDTTVDGVSILKSDILRCADANCLSPLLVFDSEITDIIHININAFTFDPANDELIFSIDSNAVIAGNTYLSSDLIRFDGTNFTLEYGPFADVFLSHNNIDGLSMIAADRFLVSFANNSKRNDIYELNTTTQTWSLAYTPFNDDYVFNHINVSSLMVLTQAVPDLLFSDGFED
jgi:hypothetical protein